MTIPSAPHSGEPSQPSPETITDLLRPLSDEHIQLEASKQLGRDVEIQKVHISLIRPSDTVFHEGKVMTVCSQNLKAGGFMGPTLFGDSYVLGLKPVQRIVMQRR